MDVILTISFKITAEIDFADEVYRFAKAYVILFIRCHEMRLHCFLLSIAQLMRLDHTERVCWWKFHA